MGLQLRLWTSCEPDHDWKWYLVRYAKEGMESSKIAPVCRDCGHASLDANEHFLGLLTPM